MVSILVPALLPGRHALVHLTLCHSSSRARMLLYTKPCGVGTAVWYLYTLSRSSCVRVVLVQQ